MQHTWPYGFTRPPDAYGSYSESSQSTPAPDPDYYFDYCFDFEFEFEDEFEDDNDGSSNPGTYARNRTCDSCSYSDSYSYSDSDSSSSSSSGSFSFRLVSGIVLATNDQPPTPGSRFFSPNSLLLILGSHLPALTSPDFSSQSNLRSAVCALLSAVRCLV